jgi:GNAT superfamily N-acetyltransferase
MQRASFASFDQAIWRRRVNLHAAIAIRREGGRLMRKNTDRKTADFAVRLRTIRFSRPLRPATLSRANHEMMDDAAKARPRRHGRRGAGSSHRLRPRLADAGQPAYAEEDRWFFRERVFTTCEVWGTFDADAMTGLLAFREGWIDQLYVLPEAQGRGLGTALLQVARNEEKEPDALYLWTRVRT